LDRAFTYALPEHLRDRVRVGSYVLVPFGRQHLPGFVVALGGDGGGYKIKPISSLLLDEPLFEERMVELAEWLAGQYLCPLADAMRVLLPPGATRKIRKMVYLTERGRAPEALETVKRAPRQREVLEVLQAAEGAVEAERIVKAVREAAKAGRILSGPSNGGGGEAAALTLFDMEPAKTRRKAEAAVKRAALSAKPKTADVTPASVDNALAALEERGFVEVRRELERPAVQAIERQVVTLVDREDDWVEILEVLQEKAPRQAEVITALVATEDGAAAVADFSRPAVTALVQKGLVTVALEAQGRAPEAMDWEGASVEALWLNDEQRAVYEAAKDGIVAGEHRELLVHGVTGSGKTEVYLHCVELALRQGRGAIVAVPEIALTPQMVGRFRARFGRQLALLHSALGQGERFDEWYRARRGEARIVIGARSAIFAPVQNLGIIIVDEEHETAYKQEQPPRYHGIAAARERARLEGAVLMLGSATPAVERYYEARQGAVGPSGPSYSDLRLIELSKRIDDRPMPDIRIVDLRGETLLGNGEGFSQRLLDGISDRLARDEQVMLFLNRRGFSTYIMCRECGEALRCPDCDISLTFHFQGHLCMCHHCDYTRSVPETCPNCGDADIGFHGLGTERVADQVVRAFPEAKVARMDRDTIGTKGAYGRILGAFAAGEANILVGTQMIAKGHDFPRVTLVGVLNADTGLYRPDFRAAEHTFQVLTQVAGRAGRADKPGEVLVQTYNPDHYSILTATRHDYLGFYEREMAARKKSLYPPFVRLVRLVFSAEAEAQADGEAKAFRRVLLDMAIPEKQGEVCFAGPAEAPLKKLRGRFRYSLLLKGGQESVLAVTQEALARWQPGKDVSVTVDVDPTDMM
jgi:primosomal protein N' (replication factor Y) (superfamily II helicase)